MDLYLITILIAVHLIIFFKIITIITPMYLIILTTTTLIIIIILLTIIIISTNLILLIMEIAIIITITITIIILFLILLIHIITIKAKISHLQIKATYFHLSILKIIIIQMQKMIKHKIIKKIILNHLLNLYPYLKFYLSDFNQKHFWKNFLLSLIRMIISK